MISNSPGSIVDIAQADRLSLYMSLWSVAPMNGPVTGPLIGGFVYQYLGWRWDNWVVLILAGVVWVLISSVRETYPPIILQKKAARMRKEMDDDRWWCRYDQKASALQLFKINMSRPFILSWSEPILWFFNIWISLAYGILYLCFVAYPIIFVEHRGWGPGISGLGFVGIGIGTMGTICSEPLLRRWINSDKKHAKPGGGTTPEAAAKVMTLGAIMTAVGQLGFSWTSLPTSIHWAVPIAFGIPFGAGNSMSFIYGANYLAGAYGNYAASALAGNAVARSAVGGTLPLVGPTMYKALTPQWAGTLLGLLEALMIAVPFVFYRYGDKIRAKSKVIRQMAEDQARNDRNDSRRARHLARAAKRSANAATTAVQEEPTGEVLQADLGEDKEVGKGAAAKS